MYGGCSTSAVATPPPLDVTGVGASSAATAAIMTMNSNDNTKRKRRPAGTPDPDAEVVALSPKTLMESDRYVCEICGQGFQRDQNLQMHRRRHKVPWKLLKRPPAAEAVSASKKRVFVCPEESCLHHDPGHALGDLVGIKKHYRRKHSSCRQWVCARCGKGYAVQSDYKAHLKTCGTRGHSCDCGRVFSRVESFIEHQDTCNASRSRPPDQPAIAPPPPPPPTSASSSSPPLSSETNFSPAGAWPVPPPIPLRPSASFHNLELQLMPVAADDEAQATVLQLSVGPSGGKSVNHVSKPQITHKIHNSGDHDDRPMVTSEAREQMRVAVAEKAAADEARRRLRRQIEMAEEEFSRAKKIRQQSQEELSRAIMLRDQATKQINAVLLQITCHGCRRQFRSVATPLISSPPPEGSASIVTHEAGASAASVAAMSKTSNA